MAHADLIVELGDDGGLMVFEGTSTDLVASRSILPARIRGGAHPRPSPVAPSVGDAIS
jgi:hypothetical protein